MKRDKNYKKFYDLNYDKVEQEILSLVENKESKKAQDLSNEYNLDFKEIIKKKSENNIDKTKENFSRLLAFAKIDFKAQRDMVFAFSFILFVGQIFLFFIGLINILYFSLLLYPILTFLVVYYISKYENKVIEIKKEYQRALKQINFSNKTI